MLSRAPVAFRWTRMSLERARRVRGTSAPDFAIFVLFSSDEHDENLLNFGYVSGALTVRRKVSDTSDRIALNLDVRAQHLSDEWFQAAQLDNKQLVLSYCTTLQ